MTRKDVLQNIMATYSKYGVTHDFIEEMKRQLIEEGEDPEEYVMAFPMR